MTAAATRGLARAWRRLTGEWAHLGKRDVLRAASAMAFHAFFSLVPLVALAGWAIQRLTHHDPSSMAPLLQLAPGAVGHLADAELLRLSLSDSAMIAPLSILGFLWLASGGVATGMRVFERIFGAAPRTWWRCRLLALGFVIFALSALCLCALAVVTLAAAGRPEASAVAIAAPVLAIWLVVAGFFRYATRREAGHSRHGGRGALVTLLLWLGVSLGFSAYVSELARYSLFYGGLATVVVLLTWLWLMAFALLLGGEINARLERRRAAAASPHD